MSISSLVPNDEAEKAILRELAMIGGDADTAYIVNRSMEHFPVLQRPEEKTRITPAGHLWWPGRFRFNLTYLKRKGLVVNERRGRWRITNEGRRRIGYASR
jgi:restriction endonuclease Mrr